jgi:HSP20 family protein
MMLRSFLPTLGRRAEPQRAESGDPFLSLHREINRLFDDTLRGWSGPAAGNGGTFVAPSIDVKETEAAVEITAELPGVDEKDVEVHLAEGVLTIRGEKKSERESKDEKAGYHLTERSYGSFSRSFELPYPVEPDKVSASFERGVLKVTLPKPPEAEKRARKIPVQKSA